MVCCHETVPFGASKTRIMPLSSTMTHLSNGKENPLAMEYSIRLAKSLKPTCIPLQQIVWDVLIKLFVSSPVLPIVLERITNDQTPPNSNVNFTNVKHTRTWSPNWNPFDIKSNFWSPNFPCPQPVMLHTSLLTYWLRASIIWPSSRKILMNLASLFGSSFLKLPMFLHSKKPSQH